MPDDRLTNGQTTVEVAECIGWIDMDKHLILIQFRKKVVLVMNVMVWTIPHTMINVPVITNAWIKTKLSGAKLPDTSMSYTIPVSHAKDIPLVAIYEEQFVKFGSLAQLERRITSATRGMRDI